MMRWHDDGLGIRLPGLPPIWMHPGLPIVAVLLTLPLWRYGHPNGLIAAAIVVPGLMLSVLGHELGHALTARRLGLTPVLIRLHVAGGEALIEGPAWSRAADRRITLAGPLANIAIGGLCLTLLWLLTPMPEVPAEGLFHNPPPRLRPPVLRALHWIGWANLLLAAVNLLPAYPLDGGHLLHSWLEQRWGLHRALFWVGLLGVGFAVLSTLVFLVSILAGIIIWSPPSLAPNWSALQASRNRRPEAVRRRE